MTITLRILLAGMLVTMAVVRQDASAGALETLMMPGPVIEGHAKYEEQCDRCHRPFTKDQQDALCNGCHEDVAVDIKQKQGYHGHVAVQAGECRHCHTEHKGRTADVIQLGTETFNHDATDYTLKGAHATAGCDACHLHGKKYRDAPARCIACHEETDVHKGDLGEACADCHSERAWTRPEFDHEKTDFPLLEKHADIDCNSCHVDSRFRQTTRECHGCHQLNDVHAGRYGQKCSDCHSEKGWDITRFDHADTGYPLEGKHSTTPCNVCHTGRLYDDKTPGECIGCHQNDDKHTRRYGKQCGSCHTPRGWSKSRYDHSSKTGFPLLGKHVDVSCTACHTSDLHHEKLDTGCYSCHAIDDVHAGQEGKQCAGCHDEHGWGEKIRFDHDMASFPLIGMHAVAPCEECHISASFRDAASNCHACHQPEDVHEQRLGKSCEDCHNPNGWSLWEFDHNTLTEFPLDGAHADIDCLACHVSEAAPGTAVSSFCADCHRMDDVHGGQFGRNCERCHNDESFTAVQVR